MSHAPKYALRLKLGSPMPGLLTGTRLWPVKNWAARQKVSGRRAREVSSASAAAPQRQHRGLGATSDHQVLE